MEHQDSKYLEINQLLKINNFEYSSFLGCLGKIADGIFSEIFGSYDYDSSDESDYYSWFRKSKPINQINKDDLKPMIEKQLERISQGETLQINPKIQRLVREAVKKLPQDIVKKLNSEDETINRRFFG